MKLSYELPTQYLTQLGTYNDINFALAHLVLTNDVYSSYYRDATKYTILDNSSFELNHPLPTQDIIKAASIIDADEIIAPDVLRDGRKTIDATTDFISFLRASGDLGRFKVMGVVQGINVPDWANCLAFMKNNPAVDVIGISYAGCACFGMDPVSARIGATHLTSLQEGQQKPIHLLGVGGNPLELVTQKSIHNVRSCDTSLPIVQGLARNKFDLTKGLIGPKLARQNNFFETDVDALQMDAIIHNVEAMRKWTSEPIGV